MIVLHKVVRVIRVEKPSLMQIMFPCQMLALLLLTWGALARKRQKQFVGLCLDWKHLLLHPPLLLIQVILATTLNAFATISNDPWVINFGISNHMTNMFSFFSSNNPRSAKDKVRITYGSLSIVSGKGFTYVTPYMTLSSILHVPDFAYLLHILPMSCIVESFFILITVFFFSGPSHRKDDGQRQPKGWFVLPGFSTQDTRSAHKGLSHCLGR